MVVLENTVLQQINVSQYATGWYTKLVKNKFHREPNDIRCIQKSMVVWQPKLLSAVNCLHLKNEICYRPIQHAQVHSLESKYERY